MKTPIALGLSLLLAVAGVSAARAADSDQDGLPSAWTALGIKLGMPYAKAKALLLAAGWKAMPGDNAAAPAFAADPEVDCGQGWQAVCSAGYAKGADQYALVLTATADGGLLVQGTY